MRNVIIAASLVVLAAPVAADPLRDQLRNESPCYSDQAPETVAWPEANGFEAGRSMDWDKNAPEITAEGEVVKGRAPVKKGSSADYSWCAETVKVEVDGKEQLLVGVAFATIGGGSDGSDVYAENQIVQWAVPMANEDATKAAAAGTLARPAAFAADADKAPYATAAIAKLTTTKKLAAIADKKVIVVGSAPGEVFQGPAAKKTLKRWNLDLALDGAVASQDTSDAAIGNQAWVLANVTAKAHGKKDATPITYRVLYGLTYTGKHGAKGKKKWTLRVVHFAIVR
jgi:hypothetical protein